MEKSSASVWPFCLRSGEPKHSSVGLGRQSTPRSDTGSLIRLHLYQLLESTRALFHHQCGSRVGLPNSFLEFIQRTFTSRIRGFQHMNNWNRLTSEYPKPNVLAKEKRKVCYHSYVGNFASRFELLVHLGTAIKQL